MTTLMAYADAISVRPGETIGFKVSCDGADTYNARIVRLLSPEAGPEAPPFRVEPVEGAGGSYPARTQPLRAGSWAIVPRHPLIAALRSFSVAALVWPTLPGDGRQAIAGTWSESGRAGLGLMLNDAGEVELRLGNILLGGFSIPVNSCLRVFLHAIAVVVKHTKVELRVGMILLRGFSIPVNGSLRVFLHAIADRVTKTN